VHERLFPLCTGCHEGVPQGDRAKFYPSPQLCAGCHNGKDVSQVNWTAPGERPTNLNFSHPQHRAAPAEDIDCSECHTRQGTSRMDVVQAVPERCFRCHAPRATNHFVDTPCQQCHVPLAETALPTSRIAALPLPPSHQRPNFLDSLHGALARTQRAQCTVCHTRHGQCKLHKNSIPILEVSRLPIHIIHDMGKLMTS
jgi:hypothetical protein